MTFDVPQKRRPRQSRLEVRYSPTLAGAMVDALPYRAWAMYAPELKANSDEIKLKVKD